jgi:tRNA nucleotidyltransferase (CCA-adding enzyme)
MEKVIYNVLKKLEDSNYESYIVGGYVRDKLLGKKGFDIDITTKARPKEVLELFPEYDVKLHDYGHVYFEIDNYKFDITTFRKDIKYEDNRKPERVEYIDSFEEDLLRRDFTINSICMNVNDKIIDLHNGRKDLKKKIICSIGDPYKKTEEDALRILRAVRFATVLDFKLSKEVKEAIIQTKHLLKNLSYQRKKEELDKIFGSIHVKYGVKLLIELGLDQELELYNLKSIKSFDNLIGTWSLLDVKDVYPFTKNEKALMDNIKEVLSLDNLDPLVLYKYGLYVNSVAGEVSGIDIKDVTEAYSNLVIHGRRDINITSEEIMKLLNKEPGSYLKDIYSDIEREILYRRLSNDKEKICKYIIKKY